MATHQSTAIERVVEAAEVGGAILAVSAKTAGVGTVVAALALATRFGLGVPISSWRMQRLLARAGAAQINLPELLWKISRLPNVAERKRELRDALRAIDEVVDDAAVGPLLAVFVLRSQGDLTAREAASVGAFVGCLDTEEMAALRRLLGEVLALAPSRVQRVHLVSRQKQPDGSFKSAVSVDRTPVAVSLFGPATRVFRLLRENDLAAADLVWGSGASVGPSDPGDATPIEGIIVEKRYVELLHHVLGT
jgi:hypothetical protein